MLRDRVSSVAAWAAALTLLALCLASAIGLVVAATRVGVAGELLIALAITAHALIVSRPVKIQPPRVMDLVPDDHRGVGNDEPQSYPFEVAFGPEEYQQ